jgi:hypothetical protein
VNKLRASSESRRLGQGDEQNQAAAVMGRCLVDRLEERNARARHACSIAAIPRRDPGHTERRTLAPGEHGAVANELRRVRVVVPIGRLTMDRQGRRGVYTCGAPDGQCAGHVP